MITAPIHEINRAQLDAEIAGLEAGVRTDPSMQSRLDSKRAELDALDRQVLMIAAAQRADRDGHNSYNRKLYCFTGVVIAAMIIYGIVESV